MSRMPKDPSSRSLLSPKAHSLLHKPYSRHEQGLLQGSSSKDREESSIRKEWEDATCPICMEHPHNAVLLICSSHDKGCRPYMCDTSYRHSNCLDQYRKAHDASDSPALGATAGHVLVESPGGNLNRVPTTTVGRGRGVAGIDRADRVEETLGEGTLWRAGRGLGAGGAEHIRGMAIDVSSERDGIDGQVVMELSNGAPPRAKGEPGELLCPLCRGKVEGWRVLDAARVHLNRKIRSCAQESCAFSGSYEELRKHARGTHPTARPSDIDPNREQDWQQLERQRDLGDVLSTIQSAMPGATVLGDYVIDGEDEDHDDEGDDNDFPGDEGNWWTVFLLFQVFGPAASMAGGRGLPSRVRGRYHQPGSSIMGNPLWGEPLPGNSGGVIGPGNLSGNVEGGIGSTSRRRRSRQRGRGDVL